MRCLPRSSCLACVACVLGLGALLGACGEALEAPQATTGPTPSAAEADASLGAKELLARLYRSVALGPALATSAFSQDVAHLRELLWSDLALEGAEAAAGAHVRASHVAGSVAVALAQDPGAREGLAQTDTFGLRIHDAWVAAAAQGPAVYRAWCAAEATVLFTRREQELQNLFDRPLK